MDLVIRTADTKDLPAIVDIYNQAVGLKHATCDLSPISVESKASWLAEHDPAARPVYVAEVDGVVAGWRSLSEYRPGRKALRFTAEISYYVHGSYRRRGIASRLIEHAIRECPRLGVKTLFAILLDTNVASVRLLEKFNFEKWGHLPRVADFNGEEAGHFYYGLRLAP